MLSPNDELANYEVLEALPGLPLESGRVDHIVGSYSRQAFNDEITMQDVRGRFSERSLLWHKNGRINQKRKPNKKRDQSDKVCGLPGVN